MPRHAKPTAAFRRIAAVCARVCLARPAGIALWRAWPCCGGLGALMRQGARCTHAALARKMQVSLTSQRCENDDGCCSASASLPLIAHVTRLLRLRHTPELSIDSPAARGRLGPGCAAGGQPSPLALAQAASGIASPRKLAKPGVPESGASERQETGRAPRGPSQLQGPVSAGSSHCTGLAHTSHIIAPSREQPAHEKLLFVRLSAWRAPCCYRHMSPVAILVAGQRFAVQACRCHHQQQACYYSMTAAG
jgi:hypothetical protein